MKKNKHLLIIYCLATLSSIIMIICFGVIQTPDSTTYVSGWNSLANGHLDVLRTPVYPLFLHLMNLVFGEHYLFATICVQHIFFIFSIYYFYKLLFVFINNDTIVLGIMLFFAVPPIVNSWCNCILTESFAISGFILLLYLTFQIVKHCSFIPVLLFSLQFVVLLLLRPIFIYILPVYFILILYLLSSKNTRIIGYSFLVSIALTSLITLLYMKEFKREYGIFSTSSVSVVNQYYIARQYNMIIPSKITDKDLTKDIDSLFLCHGESVQDHTILISEASFLAEKHPLNVLKKEVSIQIRDNLPSFVSSIIDRGFSASKHPLLYTVLGDTSQSIIRFFTFGIFLGTLFLFLFIYSITLIVWIIRVKYLPWKSLLLYLLGISNIIVAIIGAQGEWPRLIVPSISIWLVFIGQFCELLKKDSIYATVFQ